PFEVGDVFRLTGKALRLHEGVEGVLGGLELVDDDGSLVHQPDLARLLGPGARKERDRVIDSVLLAAEVEDVAVGLGVVQYTVSTTEGLDQRMVLEAFVDV